MVRNTWVPFALCTLVFGCSVASDTKSTGGVHLPDAAPSTGGATSTGGDAGTGGNANDGSTAPDGMTTDGGAAAPPTCARGVSILSSDYTSTDVSIASPLGKILSASIISSGSAPAGLTTALSGDVVFPSTAPRSGDLVLIDRTPAVLTWLDVGTAKVIHQMSVGTGFSANPHDYLEVSDAKAYVTRYETNTNPGKQKFDSGGDVLILDFKAFTITGNIPLAKPDDGAFLPRADRMLRFGNEAWVMLERLDANFKSSGSSRLVGIDIATDTVAWTLDIENGQNCGGMALSPTEKELMVSCSGDFAGSAGRALVLLDTTVSPPKEIKRFPDAVASLGGPPAPAIAFATDKLLFGVDYGDTMGAKNDVAFTMNLDTAEVKTVLDAGAAFALGDVLCAPGCTNLCFLADAQANVVHTYKTSTGTTFADDGSFKVDPTIGLPPRSLGAL